MSSNSFSGWDRPFRDTLGKVLGETTLAGGIRHYAYEKPKSAVKQAQAQARQAQEQTSSAMASATEERRRRRLMLLNPSAELGTSMATGRGQLLGV